MEGQKGFLEMNIIESVYFIPYIFKLLFVRGKYYIQLRKLEKTRLESILIKCQSQDSEASLLASSPVTFWPHHVVFCRHPRAYYILGAI